MKNLKFLESIVKMPMMGLPVRSTYVAVQNGGVLFSPGSMLTTEQLQSLGNVTDIVAPNLYHMAGMAKAISVYPSARIWGPPKAQKRKPEIPWTHTLTSAEWLYQNELPLLLLEGIPHVNEVLFLHKESKSLIVCDLCFNMTDVNGIGSWIILNIFGTYKKLAVSKLFLRAVKDRAAFQNSLSNLFKMDFEHVIVSHGNNAIQDGKTKLQAALQARGFSI